MSEGRHGKVHKLTLNSWVGLTKKGTVGVDDELAWSAAHVTDEERGSGQCTTPWLDSFGGMVEDVEVKRPMVLDLLGPSSNSDGELGHGGSV